MAGYQTIEALRPILHRGPVAMPVVNRALVRPPKPLTPLQTRQAEMRELRAGGMTTYAIAERFNTTRASVQRATARMTPPEGGWPHGGKSTRFNRPKAQRMRRAGFTFKEIAEDLGCSEANAYRLVTGKNGKGSNRNRPTRKYEDIVSRATGLKVPVLRLGDGRGLNHIQIGKARAILFWITRQRCADISYERIGRYLGGFHASSIRRGIARADAAASRLNIVLSDTCSAGKVCRALWAAQW